MVRIGYLGNHSRSWTTETHLCRALERLGHTVYRMQESETTPAQVETAAAVHSLDQVWYQRTWGYDRFPPHAPENLVSNLSGDLLAVWERLRERGVATVSYHLDLYVGLERQALLTDGAGNVVDPFWTTEFVFTADGDPRTQAWMEAHGIRHYWSPPAVAADELEPGYVDRARWPEDVVFVGSGPGYHGEHPERQELLAWATERYGPRFRRYGQPEIVVRDAELNSLYATVPAVVGDSLARVYPDGTRHENYWSDRIHETLGRGGVLVHPRVHGLEEFTGYEHRVHCLFYEFGDYDEVGRLVDWCVENPTEARAMAERGRARTREYHTYDQRLAVALAVVGRGS